MSTEGAFLSGRCILWSPSASDPKIENIYRSIACTFYFRKSLPVLVNHTLGHELTVKDTFYCWLYCRSYLSLLESATVFTGACLSMGGGDRQTPWQGRWQADTLTGRRLSVHGGRWQADTLLAGRPPPSRQTAPWQTHPVEIPLRRTYPLTVTQLANTPPRWQLNRTLRILLECIFVI